MTVALDKKRFGPWALVTGASSGIGKEFAQQIAASGINIVLPPRHTVTELYRQTCSPPGHRRVDAPIRLCSDDGQSGAYSSSVGLIPTNAPAVTNQSLEGSRLLVTYRISVSALAIMHSPRSADFRWPRSRRRQTTPHHSRSSNRLKEETTRPSQFPQDDPSFPAGSGIRTSASSPCRVPGNPVCRPDPGSARSPGYSCHSVR